MTTATNFPVDSYKEAAPHLRRPFTPAAVKFKVQATWPKDNPTGALIVSYIDARLVVERLNTICPHLWFDEYEPTPKGLMWCSLTVDGITRRDVGEGDGKGLVSDALKRAAVKFGIGVSLYATPKLILNAGEFLKPKRTSKGPTLELTPAGENRVRQLYAAWLDQHGKKAFGDPLDHGDVEGAQGDIEADPETGEVIEPTATNGNGNGSPQPTAAAARPTERPASAGQRGKINGKAAEANLSATDLANIVLAATGNDEREFASQEAAQEWLKRGLDRLPGKLVDPVLEGIAAIAGAQS